MDDFIFYQGRAGLDGFAGEKGLPGDPGDIIFLGNNQVEPPQGPKGDIGDRGFVGEFGFYGEPGEPGAYGDNGAFGRKVTNHSQSNTSRRSKQFP